MRTLLGLGLGAMVAGCTSVEVRYADAPAFDDVNAAAERASAGLSYYTLAKIHLTAAPSGVPGGTSSGKSSAEATSQTKDLPPAGAKPATQTPGNTNDKPVAATKPKGSGTTTGTNAQGAGNTLSGGKDSGDASNVSNPPAPTTSTGNVSGLPWTVTLTTISDPNHGFMMGGTNGFWSKTTITASRTPNSDRPDSVTVKAENLTATRLGQIATVLGYIISPAGASKGISEAQGTVQPPPIDFDIDAEHINATNPAADGSEWSYRLDIPVPQPKGAVSFDKAIAAAKAAKSVNYFPVPACLPAHLYFYNAGVQMADFPLVVADPDVVRLEPLPLDGKLTLSSICGASVQGATQTDPYDEIFSDLAALQKAYVQLTKPQDGQSGKNQSSGAGGTGSASGTNASSGTGATSGGMTGKTKGSGIQK